LGVANLLKVSIPLPPLEVQDEIVYKIQQINEEILQLKDVDNIREQARTYFEQQVYQA
jgi:restriction endonuclease S subunit